MSRMKNFGRIAGIIYILIAVVSPFSILYLPSILIAPDDAAATVSNLLASEGLFRLGMLADAFVFLSEVLLTVIVYILVRRISPVLSMVALLARFGMVVIQAANLANYIFVLVLLSGSAFLSIFDPAQVHALVMLFLESHELIVFVWQLFFSLHLIALGYVVFKSGYFPKLIGILLMLACVGYLFDSLSHLIFTESAAIAMIGSLFLIVGVIGELSFAIWLLVKGAMPQDVEAATLPGVG